MARDLAGSSLGRVARRPVQAPTRRGPVPLRSRTPVLRRLDRPSTPGGRCPPASGLPPSPTEPTASPVSRETMRHAHQPASPGSASSRSRMNESTSSINGGGARGTGESGRRQRLESFTVPMDQCIERGRGQRQEVGPASRQPSGRHAHQSADLGWGPQRRSRARRSARGSSRRRSAPPRRGRRYRSAVRDRRD